jgi:hypothetical protein
MTSSLVTALGHIGARLQGSTRVARNLVTDLRYGGSLAGTIESRSRDRGAADVVNRWLSPGWRIPSA